MMEKRNDCIQYLDEIIGKAICAMGRAANMLWIGIGKICDDKPTGRSSRKKYLCFTCSNRVEDRK